MFEGVLREILGKLRLKMRFDSGGGLFRGFGRKIEKEGRMGCFFGRIGGDSNDGYHQKPSIYQHFSDFFLLVSCAGKRKNYICIEIG